LRQISTTLPSSDTLCMVALEGYANEFLAAPDICRQLLQLQWQAEESTVKCNLEKRFAVPGDSHDASCWECNEGDARALHVVGRTRPPRGGEEQFGLVVEIACRGSRNVDNWVTNFTAMLSSSKLGVRRGRIHEGFARAYSSLRGTILCNVRKSVVAHLAGSDKPVLAYVVGHSLGGALATLCAYDLATSEGYVARCVTWGCPRVGDAEFAQAYISAVPATARFVQRADIVPRIPTNPADPYDDGAVLGTTIRDWVHEQHEAAGVHEYVHVCKSTQIGPDISGFDQALDTINTALDHGISAGFMKYLEMHKFAKYTENLDMLLSGKDVGNHPPSTYDAAQTAQRAAAFGLIRGFSWAMDAFNSRHQHNQNAPS